MYMYNTIYIFKREVHNKKIQKKQKQTSASRLCLRSTLPEIRRQRGKKRLFTISELRKRDSRWVHNIIHDAIQVKEKKSPNNCKISSRDDRMNCALDDVYRALKQTYIRLWLQKQIAIL